LFVVKVAAFTIRPSTGGTRNPEPAGSPAVAGKASVTMAIDA
jgi:hypothetical protein